MRRGLMAWDSDEIPVAVLRRRVERLQTEMARAGQNAMVLYTNFVRSGAVSYLTAFSPYWADGVLLVPQRGELMFATTLSKRVGGWIQSVKPVGDLINTPSPGKALGELAAKANLRRIAILELDAFPSGIYGELSAALPNAEFVDGTESFAAARAALDVVEHRLLMTSDGIAKGALQSIRVADDVGIAVGTVETYARLHGAEEVYVAIAPDLDTDRRFIRLSGPHALGRRFAIRAAVAYKGTWVRRIRTYSRDAKDQAAIDRLDKWFEAQLAQFVPAGDVEDQVGAAVSSLSDAQLAGWLAEGPVGTRPLAVVASLDRPVQRLDQFPALILTVALDFRGLPWRGGGLVHLNEPRE